MRKIPDVHKSSQNTTRHQNNHAPSNELTVYDEFPDYILPLLPPSLPFCGSFCAGIAPRISNP
jgi:hypothetical protein